MSGDIYNVMVIDDEDEMINAYQQIFSPQDEAYNRLLKLANRSDQVRQVEFAADYYQQGEDGYEALSAAKREGKFYSVIFLDMRMPPGWDGLKTAEAIRRIDDAVYIVIVSAHTDRTWEVIEKELDDRMLIIRKPFTKHEIVQAARVLSRAWG